MSRLIFAMTLTREHLRKAQATVIEMLAAKRNGCWAAWHCVSVGGSSLWADLQAHQGQYLMQADGPAGNAM